MATYTGPIFDGRADMMTAAACRRVQSQVAAEVQRRVQDLGQSSFRYEKPTYDVPGKWRSNVKTVARGIWDVITDSGIVYGAWLEGTGSRNRTTRFKGYLMWRRTFQAMNRGGAMKIAEPIIAKVVDQINA